MTSPTVFVVDDDAAVRDGVALLLETDGLAVETFDSADAFLAVFDPHRAGCLVLDVRMPNKTGPQLQQELRERGGVLPIIFLTAHGDIPTTVKTIQAGAIDFLTKPADGAQLLERVREALKVNQADRERLAAKEAANDRLAALTPRERDVLALAIAGHPNKEIARRLGISFRTVEVHRSRILLKTGATTLLGLAQLASDVGLLDRAEEPPASRQPEP